MGSFSSSLKPDDRGDMPLVTPDFQMPTIEQLGNQLRRDRPDVIKRYALDLEDSPMTDQELGRWAKTKWADHYANVHESPDPDIAEAAAHSNAIKMQDRPQFAREISAAERAAGQEESAQSLLHPTTPLLPEGSLDFGGAVTSESILNARQPTPGLTGSPGGGGNSEQPRPRTTQPLTLPMPGVPGGGIAAGDEVPATPGDPEIFTDIPGQIMDIPGNVPRTLSKLDRNLANLSQEAGKEWMNVVEEQGYSRDLPGAATQFLQRGPLTTGYETVSRMTQTPSGQEALSTPTLPLGELFDPGLLKGAAETAGGLTAPVTGALIAGAASVGAVPGVAGVVLKSLVSAGFSFDMLHGAYQRVPEFTEAVESGDTKRAAQLFVELGLGGLMGVGAGVHAASGPLRAGVSKLESSIRADTAARAADRTRIDESTPELAALAELRRETEFNPVTVPMQQPGRQVRGVRGYETDIIGPKRQLSPPGRPATPLPPARTAEMETGMVIDQPPKGPKGLSAEEKASSSFDRPAYTSFKAAAGASTERLGLERPEGQSLFPDRDIAWLRGQREIQRQGLEKELKQPNLPADLRTELEAELEYTNLSLRSLAEPPAPSSPSAQTEFPFTRPNEVSTEGLSRADLLKTGPLDQTRAALHDKLQTLYTKWVKEAKRTVPEESLDTQEAVIESIKAEMDVYKRAASPSTEPTPASKSPLQERKAWEMTEDEFADPVGSLPPVAPGMTRLYHSTDISMDTLLTQGLKTGKELGGTMEQAPVVFGTIKPQTSFGDKAVVLDVPTNEVMLSGREGRVTRAVQPSEIVGVFSKQQVNNAKYPSEGVRKTYQRWLREAKESGNLPTPDLPIQDTITTLDRALVQSFKQWERLANELPDPTRAASHEIRVNAAARDLVELQRIREDLSSTTTVPSLNDPAVASGTPSRNRSNINQAEQTTLWSGDVAGTSLTDQSTRLGVPANPAEVLRAASAAKAFQQRELFTQVGANLPKLLSQREVLARKLASARSEKMVDKFANQLGELDAQIAEIQSQVYRQPPAPSAPDTLPKPLQPTASRRLEAMGLTVEELPDTGALTYVTERRTATRYMEAQEQQAKLRAGAMPKVFDKPKNKWITNPRSRIERRARRTAADKLDTEIATLGEALSPAVRENIDRDFGALGLDIDTVLALEDSLIPTSSDIRIRPPRVRPSDIREIMHQRPGISKEDAILEAQLPAGMANPYGEVYPEPRATKLLAAGKEAKGDTPPPPSTSTQPTPIERARLAESAEATGATAMLRAINTASPTLATQIAKSNSFKRMRQFGERVAKVRKILDYFTFEPEFTELGKKKTPGLLRRAIGKKAIGFFSPEKIAIWKRRARIHQDDFMDANNIGAQKTGAILLPIAEGSKASTAPTLNPLSKPIAFRRAYDIFRNIIVTEDLLALAKQKPNVELPGQPEGMPTSAYVAELKAGLAKGREATKAHPFINESLKLHRETMSYYGKELHRRGLIPEEAINRPYYTHSLTGNPIEYLAQPIETLPIGNWRSPSRSPYALERKGASTPIDMDYHNVIQDHIARIELDTMTENFVLDMLGDADISNRYAELTIADRTALTKALDIGAVKADQTVIKLPDAGDFSYVSPLRTNRGETVHTGPEGNHFIRAIKWAAAELSQDKPTGPESKMYLVPSDLANRAAHYYDIKDMSGLMQAAQFAKTAMSIWKQSALMFSYLPYQITNLVGDINNLYLDDGMALFKLPKAARAVLDKSYDPTTTAFSPDGTPQSILELAKQQRIGVAYGARSSEITTEGRRALQDWRFRYLWGVTDVVKFAKHVAWDDVSGIRESIPRLAKFMKDVERIEKGGTVKTRVDLGALPPDSIITAGHAASTALIDYAAVSKGNALLGRGILLPFTTFYYKNARNWARAATHYPGLSGPTGAAAGMASFTTKIIAPHAALWYWNNVIMGDVESGLTDYAKSTTHFNVPQPKEGPIADKPHPDIPDDFWDIPRTAANTAAGLFEFSSDVAQAAYDGFDTGNAKALRDKFTHINTGLKTEDGDKDVVVVFNTSTDAFMGVFGLQDTGKLLSQLRRGDITATDVGKITLRKTLQAMPAAWLVPQIGRGENPWIELTNTFAKLGMELATNTNMDFEGTTPIVPPGVDKEHGVGLKMEHVMKRIFVPMSALNRSESSEAFGSLSNLPLTPATDPAKGPSWEDRFNRTGTQIQAIAKNMLGLSRAFGYREYDRAKGQASTERSVLREIQEDENTLFNRAEDAVIRYAQSSREPSDLAERNQALVNISSDTLRHDIPLLTPLRLNRHINTPKMQEAIYKEIIKKLPPESPDRAMAKQILDSIRAKRGKRMVSNAPLRTRQALNLFHNRYRDVFHPEWEAVAEAEEGENENENENTNLSQEVSQP